MFGGKKARPDTRDVATRALILRQVAVYAMVTPPRGLPEEVSSRWPPAELEKFRAAAVKQRDEFWSQLGRLKADMSPWERGFAISTPLTMTADQQTSASWRIEAFQVLLWALGVLPDLPPFDTPADHALLKAPPVSISSPSLISADRIEQARDDAELWNWRSRTRQIVEEGTPFPEDPRLAAAGLTSYDDIVRRTAEHAATKGRLKVIDGDFEAFGKPYRALEREQWETVRSITVERHFALNWLCGYAPGQRWDETPTDT